MSNASLARVELKTKTLLNLRRTVELNLSKAFDHPNLKPLQQEIASKTRQLEDILVAFARGSESERFNPLNEDRVSSDDLSTALPSYEKLRRRQSKELGRRLYSKYHPDRAEGQSVLMDFSGLRELVNSGEVEVLRYLDSALNNQQPPDDLERMLDVRINVYQSQPSFRLVQLYLSGSDSYVKEAARVLTNKKRLLDQRLGDLFTMSSRSNHEAHNQQG